MSRMGGHWCIRGSAVSFPLTTFDTLSYGICYNAQRWKLERPPFCNLSNPIVKISHNRFTMTDSYYCTESITTSWVPELKTELLRREDCNVILVDWPKGAKGSLWNYRQAAGNTRLVGAQTAELIRFLINSSSSGSARSTDRFYIVGFSLGAQVAGYAGSYLRARRMRLGRITGKDILK